MLPFAGITASVRHQFPTPDKRRLRKVWGMCADRSRLAVGFLEAVKRRANPQVSDAEGRWRGPSELVCQ